MLHMYRDVKKTSYTQTKNHTHPYTQNKHTQTTKPHRPVWWGSSSGLRGWPRFRWFDPGNQGWNGSPKKKKQTNKKIKYAWWETINGKDAVFFCNKNGASKWKIKNELKIVQKRGKFYKKKGAREKNKVIAKNRCWSIYIRNVNL